jgi:hypothetical protein
MCPSKFVLGLTVALGVAAAVSASAVASRVEQRVIPIDQRQAIKIALARFGNSWMLDPFPRGTGRVACEIPGGGLAGGSFSGTCQTRVFKGRRFVTVTFTEAWDSSVFNGDGVPPHTTLTHSWIVIESPKLVALDTATVGDFPPQWVR